MTRRFWLLVLGAGCADTAGITETGNPEADVNVALVQGRSETRASPLGLDTAWVFVDDLRLELAEGCDGPQARELEIPAVVAADLRGPSPQVLTAVVEQTDYCRLRVRFDRADRGDGPPGFEDLALWMTGTTAQGTPWSLRTRERLEVDLRAESAPFTFDQATEHLLLAFDLQGWLSGLGIDSLSPEGGQIRIDDDANDDVLEAFLERADQALRLHRDGDADEVLDDDEELLAGEGS